MKRGAVIFRGDRHAAEAEGAGLRLDDGRHVTEEEVAWLPPFEPRTILAVGLNYAAHARELGLSAAAGAAGIPQGSELGRGPPLGAHRVRRA